MILGVLGFFNIYDKDYKVDPTRKKANFPNQKNCEVITFLLEA